MLADPLPIDNDVDPKMRQLCRGADAGPHKDRRGMGRAAGNDNLVRMYFALAFRAFDG